MSRSDLGRLRPLEAHERLLSQHTYVTPSNINPWRDPRRPDELFTATQLDLMPLYQLDPATAPFVAVRSPASQRDMWWGRGSRTPVYVIPCPIIGTPQADGRVLVLSPAGMKKLVCLDGTIGRPATRKLRRSA